MSTYHLLTSPIPVHRRDGAVLFIRSDAAKASGRIRRRDWDPRDAQEAWDDGPPEAPPAASAEDVPAASVTVMITFA